jgi:chaperone required for assembly of F1-ATPase
LLPAKRFYREATSSAAAGGHRILLDGKALRSPAGAEMLLPAALAAAIAAEWDAQQDQIQPHSMPLMRLASTAIDRVALHREGVVDEIAGYAATDLVCYRAEHPPELVARQHAVWQPLVDWVRLRYDAPLLVTTGVLPRPQPPEALAALRGAVAALDPMRLTALHAAVTAAGSLVIGLALLEGRLAPAAAWDASQLDETFQIERWGEDQEAATRRTALRREMEDARRFLDLLLE